jgi:phage terminase small subunit
MPKRKITLKQIKFIKFYFECNGNVTEAALKAGYRVRQSGDDNMSNPVILAAIEEIKKKNGLTDEFLLQKHMQLINAKRFQSCDVYVSKENGGYKINENSNDLIEVDDNQVQVQALKLAYEINGKLIKKIEHSGTIKHTFTQEERDARLTRLKDYLQLSSN